MKKLLILSLLLCTVAAHSKTVARVLGVEGNAFNFMSSKKAKQLIYGSKIEDASVVMVEDGASISIKDESGRVYHLGGGSQVKIFDKLVEVQKGFIWVSSSLGKIGTISSANSVVKYTQGQFIYNFDNYTSKSQVMVLTGNVQLSNSVEPELLVEVPAGHFSFVDNKVSNGMPRGATRVGMSSYKSFKSVFTNNERIQHKTFDRSFGNQAPAKRAIASVDESDQFDVAHAPKGKILYFGKNKRIPASSATSNTGPSPMKYYKSIINRKPKKKKIVKVKMRVFGLDDTVVDSKVDSSATKMAAVVAKPEDDSFFKRKYSKKKFIELEKQRIAKLKANAKIRETAKLAAFAKKQSESKKQRMPSSLSGYEKGATAFERSLQQSERLNRRHSDERNALIDELKSYNSNYKKQY